MARVAKTYHPGKVKTHNTMRHYGWLDRDEGPKMDQKNVGESWNLVQRRLRMMEGRDGAMQAGAYACGTIQWGSQRGPLRGLQAGSCVFASTLVQYPYRPVDLYLPRYAIPPFEWPPYDAPPVEAITCSDLWEGNEQLSDYEVEARADEVVVPFSGFMPSSCWAKTCADFWAEHPEIADHQVAENEDKVVWPDGSPNDCWDVDFNVPVPDLPDIPPLFIPPMPYLNPEGFPHLYQLVADEDSVEEIPEGQQDVILEKTIDFNVLKMQTEKYNSLSAAIQNRAVRDAETDRRRRRSGGLGLPYRLFEEVETGGDNLGNAHLWLDKVEMVSATLIPKWLIAPQTGQNYRMYSTILYRYRLRLPRFKLQAKAGDFYVVTINLDGVNRNDQSTGDTDMSETTIKITLPEGAATGELLVWNQGDGKWTVPSVGTLEDGDILKWNASASKWEKGELPELPDGTNDDDVLLWDTDSGEWQPGAMPISMPEGDAEGQILFWDNTEKTWIKSTVGALANGDALKWDGSKWVKTNFIEEPSGTFGDLLRLGDTGWELVSPTSLVRYDAGTKQLQVKVGDTWTMITGGQAVPLPE